MSKSRIRIQPTPTTSIVVTTADTALTIEVAAVGVDEESGGPAARLRVIAHELMRYADSLDPLWVEDLVNASPLRVRRDG